MALENLQIGAADPTRADLEHGSLPRNWRPANTADDRLRAGPRKGCDSDTASVHDTALSMSALPPIVKSGLAFAEDRQNR